MKNLIINERDPSSQPSSLFHTTLKVDFPKVGEIFKKSGQERKARSKKKTKKKKRYEKRIIQETQSHKQPAGGVRQERQTVVSSNDFHGDKLSKLISAKIQINQNSCGLISTIF